MQRNLVKLNSARDFQRAFGRVFTVSGSQSHTQHPIEHQRQKADQRMRTNPIGQAMEDRRNLDLGLQDAESTLDIRQRLVATHDLDGSVIRHIAHQNQFAIHHPRTVQCALVDIIGECFGRQINLDDAGQMGIAYRLVKARRGAGIGEFLASVRLADLLTVQFARPLRRICLQRRNLQIARLSLLAGLVGLIMGGSQALTRSTYSKFLPETTDTASFFSFYDVSYYVGTVLGTTAYGIVYALTEDLRSTIIAIGSFFVAGLLLLWRVPKEEVLPTAAA